eukprot:SAG22_NODE_807_length_7081_cov_2.460756_7_plen_37_part_00
MYVASTAARESSRQQREWRASDEMTQGKAEKHKERQ